MRSLSVNRTLIVDESIMTVIFSSTMFVVIRILGIYPDFLKFLAALDGVHFSSSTACGISS